jgi:glutaredoxin
MKRVTLYGKPGCHLCDDARAALAEFDVREIDVSVDPHLHALYGDRIPVVEVDGEEVCHFHVDPEAVRARLGRVAP